MKKEYINLEKGTLLIPKGIGKNAYGNNFYIGSGLIFDIADDLNFNFSYTIPLGPGNNYFNTY